MTEKRFVCINESIINIQTDELVNASSEESAKIVVDWLNELEEENEQLKKELDKLKVVNEMLSIDFSNSEHELWRENEQLKKNNKLLMDKMFEMRTNNALDRTEISKQHYSVNEFLEDLEKW